MGKGSHEEKFTKYLDSLEKDEMNHLIPLLDTVDCPDTGEVFLVTPMFREIGRGSIFHCCEEVIDFIQQMLDVSATPSTSKGRHIQLLYLGSHLSPQP